ncbi:MAG: M14 family zinc carboxypeptidase [Vicinamibacterales bacterium]
MRRAILFAALVLTATSASAQPAFQPAPELSPGTRYDTNIPTITQVLGYDHGERITTPDDVGRYLRALADAAPDRARLTEYARSWQDRPLWLFIVGSRERMARIDEIKASRQQLANPAPGDASGLIQNQPVITALTHSVHGNEASGVDAALAEAYHLLAATGDPTVDLIMRESIVLIDPMQNPDGRARFISSNTHAQAMRPDPDPVAAEHDEGWPGGRTNHYLFDLNRDWFPQNHPESQGKVRFLLDWLPQVTVDLHEMGGESQYYFPPAAAPNTPNTTEAQRNWMVTFGRANAARFDERGFHYFMREIYDSFYPGYGASWPFFIGSLGKTFEMAGTRGLALRRSDGTLLTYRDGVVRHFTAAIQTAATAAANREKMLRDFVDYRRSAVAEGGTTEYVLAAGNDPTRAERLADLLMKNGLEVRRVEAPVKVAGREIAAGSFIVPLAQPMGRFVRTLLDPQTTMGDEFIAEQDRRRKLRMPDQIYDITAWSLPLLYDVDLIVTDRPTGAKTAAWTSAARPAAPVPAAKVGYLIPWGAGMASAMSDLTREGMTVRAAGAGFTLAGRQYGIGTAVVRADENPDDVRDRLSRVAAAHNLEVLPIDTAWSDAGASLGSNHVRIVRTPRVLLVWDAPAQSLSAGWARFSLERRFNQPVTAVRAGSLGRATLANYDVIVVPAGSYGSVLGGAMLDRVREWMRTGGTLITLGEASRWAASAGLLDTYTELRGGRPDRPAASQGGQPASGAAPARPSGEDTYDYDAAITPPRERPEATSGVITRVLMNMEHWLSSGTDGEIQAMVEGNRVFRPLTLDRGTNVGVYAAGDRLVAGGLVWPDVGAQLAQKAFLMHQPVGQGHIIAFAEDPNFRGFTELTQMLLMNAVLFGPIR